MNFTAHDSGPFWMDNINKLSTKYDKVLDEVEVKERSKVRLLVDLMKKCVDTSKKRFLKEDLVELCTIHNIETTFEQIMVNKGWCGAPKGILQVLYERGFINKDYVKTPRSTRYPLNGKNNNFDQDGEIKDESKEFILTTTLNKCKDFLEEN